MAMGPLPARSVKQQLRGQLRARRDELTAAERRASSEAIARRLRALPEGQGDGPVLAYAASPYEVDLDDLLTSWAAEGRAVWLPWVAGEHLGIARVHDVLADLSPGYRGIREPAASGVAPADLSGLKLALVPGLGFSADGARLGHGGGHFDRLLAGRPADLLLIGVAFDLQVVPTILEEPHDRRVDIVVTERRVLRPSQI
ncbi:MAG: 5-formyltetrahydrofolate cyclo-ligase [Egibacteraceae bacterium]